MIFDFFEAAVKLLTVLRRIFDEPVSFAFAGLTWNVIVWVEAAASIFPAVVRSEKFSPAIPAIDSQ